MGYCFWLAAKDLLWNHPTDRRVHTAVFVTPVVEHSMGNREYRSVDPVNTSGRSVRSYVPPRVGTRYKVILSPRAIWLKPDHSVDHSPGRDLNNTTPNRAWTSCWDCSQSPEWSSVRKRKKDILSNDCIVKLHRLWRVSALDSWRGKTRTHFIDTNIT